ncbi:DUF2157 domain-containing protein [Massilia sp. RP-1-19]|uniref:DUF2157 domain-containing protein n=1 Tax=Massilia polaris TaxID=2728846 RepID=A0A848HH01_9BURK|nr:DUF2157 domain-containing protein [Massilia polaris]NML60705.1 DUF2157 domain-containing protein [Massilia polaris]
MDLRLAVYELTARHELDADARRRLHALAGLDDEPKQLEPTMMKGLAMLSAFLGGTGIVFWIAANWDSFGRAGRFALLQGFFVVMCLGAARLPQARAALATVAFMTMGGLFAYFGQTYQTGADPWQLFATWSLLSLPLCFAVKSDALWTAWCWVTMTGISLWVAALSGHRWSFTRTSSVVHLSGWGLALATCGMLTPLVARVTGAGKWSCRSAIALTMVMISLSGLIDLFDRGEDILFPLALAIAATAAIVLIQPKRLDVFNLSAVGLCLDTLLIALLAKVLVDRNEIFGLLMLGLSAAAILGGTVHIIVSAARNANQLGGEQ